MLLRLTASSASNATSGVSERQERMARRISAVMLRLQTGTVVLWVLCHCEPFLHTEAAEATGLPGLPGIFWFLAGTFNLVLAQSLLWSAPREEPVNKLVEGPELLQRLTLAAFVVTETEAGESCAICIDDFVVGENVRRLRCGHLFHAECISRWILQSVAGCPYRCSTEAPPVKRTGTQGARRLRPSGQERPPQEEQIAAPVDLPGMVPQ